MENPFKEIFNLQAPPDPQGEKEVLENIQFKGFLLSILELFSSLFGWVAMASGPASDNPQDPVSN